MSKVHVVSPGRNAGNFILNCVESVERQTLTPDSHIIIDDVSDDHTVEILKTCENRTPYLKIVHNTERQYRLKNIYDHSINKDPEDIICVVDSDDWLATKDAIAKIKQTYEANNKLEYVYSNFRMSHESAPGLSRAIPSNDWDPYRDNWITSHMCTFKVKALRAIPTDNFLDPDGNWFRMGTDHACVLPIIYYLRQRDGDYSAVQHVEDILYVYHFHGNPSKPRTGPIGDKLAHDAWNNSQFIKQRGYIKDAD